MPELGKLPAANLAQAAPHFRRPFHPNAVKFRPVGGGSVVAYVDVRVVIERLNAVAPADWETTFEPYPGSSSVLCHLKVYGLTRSDVGNQSNIDKLKGGYSDSLKRAAVHFGIGVSLYALKRVESKDLPSGAIKDKALTPDGIVALRKGYAGWLEREGEKKFGEALDHGDEPDAVGTLEEAADEPSETARQPSLEETAKAEELNDQYEALPDKRGWGQAKWSQMLKAATAQGLEGLATLEAQLKAKAGTAQ